MSEPRFDLEERLLEFAVRVIRVTESMMRTRAGVYVADQLVWIFSASIRTAENNRPVNTGWNAQFSTFDSQRSMTEPTRGQPHNERL